MSGWLKLIKTQGKHSHLTAILLWAYLHDHKPDSICTQCGLQRQKSKSKKEPIFQLGTMRQVRRNSVNFSETSSMPLDLGKSTLLEWRVFKDRSSPTPEATLPRFDQRSVLTGLPW